MPVLTCGEISIGQLEQLFNDYGLKTHLITTDENIPGSYWQEPEAGLIDNTLYVRNDTPVHSALHEACHYICMDQKRRNTLDTNAGGDYEEENGVCYLQILLADQLKGINKQRMFEDMDEWGYTFRLGSSKKWFEKDAEDAKQWLISHKIIDAHSHPTQQLRID